MTVLILFQKIFFSLKSYCEFKVENDEITLCIIVTVSVREGKIYRQGCPKNPLFTNILPFFVSFHFISNFLCTMVPSI